MRTIIWFLYFWLYLIVVLPEYWRVCRMEKRGETERHDRLEIGRASCRERV